MSEIITKAEINKLIALFVGRVGKINPNLYTFIGLHDITNDTWYRLDDTKFDSSWDWLMPVIDKIRSLGYIYEQGNRLNDDFTSRYFVAVRHVIDKKRFGSTTFSDDGLKQLSYNAVVEFILWYNENKSK